MSSAVRTFITEVKTDSTTEAYRASLRNLVEALLSSTDICSKTPNESKYALEVLNHTVANLKPSTVAWIPTPNEPVIEDDDKPKKDICIEFSWWLTSRLVRLLFSSKCSSLHESIAGSCSKLLLTLSSHDLYSHQLLIEEYRLCLKDLVEALELFCQPAGHPSPQRIQRFDTAVLSSRVQLVVTMAGGDDCAGSVINNFTECCSAIECILNVFGSMPATLAGLGDSSLAVMFEFLTVCLKNGSVSLKAAALSCLSDLWAHRGLPDDGTLTADYLLQCVAPIFILLKSPPTAESKIKEFKKFRIKLVAFLEVLSAELGTLQSSTKQCLFQDLANTYRLEEASTLADTETLAVFFDLVGHAFLCALAPGVDVSEPKELLDDFCLELINCGNCLLVALKYLMLSADCEIAACLESYTQTAPVVRKEGSLKRKHSKMSMSHSHTGEKLSTLSVLDRLAPKAALLCEEIISALTEDKVVAGLAKLVATIEILSYAAMKIDQDLLDSPGLSRGCMGPGLWFSGDLQRSISRMWSKTLKKLQMGGGKVVESHQLPITAFCSVYPLLCATASPLLLIPGETFKFADEIISRGTTILTLPWAKKLDVHSSMSVERLSGFEAGCDTLGPGHLKKNVDVLLLTDTSCFTSVMKWNLAKHFLESPHLPLRMRTLRQIPRVLHSDPSLFDTVLPQLRLCLEEPSTRSGVGEIIGDVCCAVSGCSVIYTHMGALKGEEARGCFSSRFGLVCCECSPGENIIKAGTGKKLPLEPFVAFFDLLKKGSGDIIQLGMIEQSLTKMFHHIDFQGCGGEMVEPVMAKCTGLLSLNSSECVVEALCVIIRHIVRSLGERSKENKILVSRMKAILSSDKMNLKLCVVQAAGDIGRSSKGVMGEHCLVILLGALTDPCSVLSSEAYTGLCMLAENYNYSMRQLYARFKSSVCQFLVDTSVDSRESPVEKPQILKLFYVVKETFKFRSIQDLLQSSQKEIVPLLVRHASPAASSVLKVMANEQQTSRKNVLTKLISSILCHLFLTCSKQEFDEKLSYLEAESEFERERLLRLDFQSVHDRLLLQLSAHYQQVTRGIAYLIPFDRKVKFQAEKFTDEQIAEYLESKLLGVIAFFDSLLLNDKTPIEEKKLVINSLASIIEFMGVKRITAVRMKVMTTLKLGLQFDDDGSLEICCNAWTVFVQNLEFSSLGPLLSQIVGTLIPLLHKRPARVAKIFKFLIIDSRSELRDYFGELYFLPDIPELASVKSALKTIESFERETTLKSRLERTLAGVRHESMDVRKHALTNLKHLLHSSKPALRGLVLNSDRTDSVVNEVVQVLLGGCLKSGDQARTLFGECLGQLGAIDPGRLQFLPKSLKVDGAAFYSNVEEQTFAYDYIRELINAFMAAENTTKQDGAAYAIQMALSFYSITSSSDCVLWNRFSSSEQEIITPYFQSQYMYKATSEREKWPLPLYGSSVCGETYEKWVCCWAVQLGASTSPARCHPAKVFHSCLHAMTNSVSLALYLLPHIVVHALAHEPPELTQKIYAEVMAVLNAAESDPRTSKCSHISVQTVFSVLDTVRTWRTQTMSLIVDTSDALTGACARMEKFLSDIPQGLLAAVSYNCQNFTRSLLHFENHLSRSESESLQDHLSYLQKLYCVLDEPDGVAGVMALWEKQPPLEDQILSYESVGMLTEAVACYEQALQASPERPELHQGLVGCLMDLGQWTSALTHATGAIAESSNWTADLNHYRVEASWKLGRWDALESFLPAETSSSDWGVGLGNLLLHARHKDEAAFVERLSNLTDLQMGPLSAASMEGGSFQRGYDYIVRLHMLSEIEHAARTFLLCESPVENVEEQLSQMFAHWKDRLEMVQASYKTVEPILTLRRGILSLIGTALSLDISKEICLSWLQSCQAARESNQVQTAYSSLLNARNYSLPQVALENAQWLWDRGETHQAQTCLESYLKEHYAGVVLQDMEQSDREQYARIRLRYANYSEENSSLESKDILSQYQEAIELAPTWENAYFHLGQYYDKLMQAMTSSDQPEKQGGAIVLIVRNFAHSLYHGSQFVYQSLPRALSLWMDYGTEVSRRSQRPGQSEAAIAKQRKYLSQLNECVTELKDKLSPYQWLTAFSQLVSRICHTHSSVFTLLQEIIAKLILDHPQQTIWNLMSVSKSSYSIRQQRCNKIFEKARLMRPEMRRFIVDSTKLTDLLLDLCNKGVEHGTAILSISKDFKALKRLKDDPNFSQILLPVQSHMTVTLPASKASGCSASFDPFPGPLVYLYKFEDKVEVLASLQKPKKVTIRGSDGKLYAFLCKPKDDLRKDARLMEFNTIINTMLQKDPEARRRQLHIRTYSVVPLNEECGLLEWVPATSGYRSILTGLYKEKGVYTSMKVPVAAFEKLGKNPPLEKRLPVFKKMVSLHPPLFNLWFLRTFPDPTSWYSARLAYARTLAVMSIVGHILGLGDRHGENILFDSASGDVVHVDFNCLFNKGLTFGVPEVVPFRLTHNMIQAMGPMGYEGFFRRACEVTLKIMRGKMSCLMSVLKPFIYDPLVEWSKPVHRSKVKAGQSASAAGAHMGTGEITNEEGLAHVQDIEEHLRGVLRSAATSQGLPLSIEGYVNHLIKEAACEENLSKMYYGWGAFM